MALTYWLDKGKPALATGVVEGPGQLMFAANDEGWAQTGQIRVKVVMLDE
jgi:hypothetical protein